jgi:hypothetical protein
MTITNLHKNDVASRAEVRRAEELLPTLLAAGYALVGGGTCRLTALGVARVAELERRRGG